MTYCDMLKHFMKNLLISLILACVAMGVEAQVAPASTPKSPELPRFDFEFKGGSPKELVDALNVPLRGSLNVIIPDESNKARIPAIKVKEANVQQIFEALTRASQRSVYMEVQAGGRKAFQSASDQIMFNSSGPITENTVWAFQFLTQRPPPISDSVRFYQLEPYLDGLKVDDIVTAIQTAWKMLGDSPGAKLKYHPESKLMIAVGQEADFALIDAALKELPKKVDSTEQTPAVKPKVN